MMPDREKVLKGLFCCRFRYENDRLRCKFCPYKSERIKKGENYSVVIGGCVNQLKIDALELLKEQKPVTPYVNGEGNYCCESCDL